MVQRWLIGPRARPMTMPLQAPFLGGEEGWEQPELACSNLRTRAYEGDLGMRLRPLEAAHAARAAPLVANATEENGAYDPGGPLIGPMGRPWEVMGAVALWRSGPAEHCPVGSWHTGLEFALGFPAAAGSNQVATDVQNALGGK